MPKMTKRSYQEERNKDIYRRVLAGETQVSLANEYGICYQRVSTIVHTEHKKHIEEVGLIEASKDICN